LAQLVQSDDYRGKRVRFAADVRTESVAERAVLWLRADAIGKTIVIDNMHARPIVGTTDWKRHEVVLDIPPNASAVGFGLMMQGTGAAWIEDVKLEVVPDSVPATLTPFPPTPRSPQNLDFALR
jgi:hypothetical protein